MHKIAPLILIALNVKQYCAQATAQANDPISLAIEIFELRRPAIVCKGLAWDFVSSKPFPALITDMRAFSNFRLWQGGGGVICSKEFGWSSVAKTLNGNDDVGVRHPWVVLHDDASQLQALQLRPSQRIFFLETTTGMVRECYTTGAKIVTDLGKIMEDGTYKPLTKDSFLSRRSRNFAGQKLVTLTEDHTPFTDIDPDVKYETTTLASGSPVDIVPRSAIKGVAPLVMDELSKEMNLTWDIYRREDHVWGNLLPDGSFSGMFENLVNGDADLAASSHTYLPTRHVGADFILAIGHDAPGIFIKRSEVGSHELDWTVYLDPFSRSMWRVIFIYCALYALVIKIIALAVTQWKGIDNPLQLVLDYVYNCYIMFRSNLGGAPYPIDGDKTTPLKSLLFSIFLASNIIWMSYRASLISELTSSEVKLPFITLTELLESNYDLVTQRGGSMMATFKNSHKGTAFNSLFEKYFKEDELSTTFVDVSDGVNTLMRKQNIALYYTADTLFVMEQLMCQLYMPWQAASPMHMGFAFAKRSPYIELVQFQMLRLAEMGVLSKIQRQLIKGPAVCADEPNLQLGFSKLVSLFSILAGGYAIASALCSLEMLLMAKKVVNPPLKQIAAKKKPLAAAASSSEFLAAALKSRIGVEMLCMTNPQKIAFLKTMIMVVDSSMKNKKQV